MTVTRFDLRQMGKVVKTDAGFLKCPVSATRVGVFTYYKPDGSVYRELRLPEEVFDEASMDSLKGVPFTKRHPTEFVNAKNAKKYMTGFTSDRVEKSPDGVYLNTSVTITDSDMIEAAESGKMREVSCGYTCELEEKKGEWNGEKYDAIQRNIRYNHLAGVERGRAGNQVKLHMDSDTAIYNDSDLDILFDEDDMGRRFNTDDEEDLDTEIDETEDDLELDDDDGEEEEEHEDGGPGSGPQGGGGSRSKEARTMKRQKALGKSNASAVAFSKKSGAIKKGIASRKANIAQSNHVKSIKAAKKRANDDDSNSHSTGGTMAKIQLGGAEYEVESGLAHAIVLSQKDAEKKGRSDAIGEAKKAVTKAQETAQAKIDELTEENKTLKTQKADSAEIHKQVVARAALIAKATPFVKAETKFDEMDELAIKKAVIAAKYPELKLDEKSPDYVGARFDALVESEPVKKPTDDLKKTVGKLDADRDKGGEELTADQVRERRMKADSEAWMKPIGNQSKNKSNEE